MHKKLKAYHFTTIQQQLFNTGKLDDYRCCIEELIKRLRFAREMRSLEQWCNYQDQAVAWCEMLQNLCILDNVERHILYDFIMENGKRDH